ncbi:MAG: leucyl aminopeptidase [Hyphomicrobiales bacterium]|nr:leucyl aminopeptidase [Hyphomicrobiales bacterium]
MKISFVNFGIEVNGSIVVFFTEENGLLITEKSENDKNISKLFQANRKHSKEKTLQGDILDIISPHGNEYKRIIFFKLKNITKLDENEWINIGGQIHGYLTQNNIQDVSIRLETTIKNIELTSIPSKIAFGMGLRAYSFSKYKSDNKKKNKANIKFLTNHHVTAENLYKSYLTLLNGVNLTRDLVNEPSNILTPKEFVTRIKEIENSHLRIKVLPQKKLEQMGMEAFLCVSKGSRNEPYVAIMEYLPNKNQKPIVFLGKGVTFDSGGISIKPAGGMDEMKGDMAGAASVVGLMKVLSEREAKVNVVGVVGLVENMTDGNAVRPGDVIKSMSGKTIEVLNTDAEGRLVLADIATYAIKNYDPQSIIDLATLTGAILVALGQEMAGVFSNNDELAQNLITSGEKTGELLWRMPIGKSYRKMIDSKVADIKNIGGRYAGATTAAEFIHCFTNDVPWAHLDIAGTSISSLKNDINTSWASGFGVRLLNKYLEEFIEK